jgi:hypothetical protein
MARTMEPPIVTVGLFVVTVATAPRHPWHGVEFSEIQGSMECARLFVMKYSGLSPIISLNTGMHLDIGTS